MNITTYSFGQITVDGTEYRSDVIICPNRVDGKWWRKEGHRLTVDDLKDVWPLKPKALVVGTGSPGLLKVDKEVEKRCQKDGIGLHVAPTAKAVEIYNQLAAGDTNLVAALHLTC
jgi:hypothetical protein